MQNTHYLKKELYEKIKKNTNGKPIRMIGAHNDITQQKNDENNLKNITDELRAIIDSSLNGIAAFKPFFDEKGEIVDFIFTMVNREACKIVNLDIFADNNGGSEYQTDDICCRL